jgi:hypothetical protein
MYLRVFSISDSTNTSTIAMKNLKVVMPWINYSECFAHVL